MKHKGPGSAAVWLVAITYASVGFSIYFALGVVAKRGLELTPVIFLIAGFLFVLTMLSYVEGGAMLRERGGSSALARHAFNELVAFIAGWVILLDYLIVIALAVLTVPRYLEPITGPLNNFWTIVFTAGVVAYITALNMLDIPARRRPRALIGLALADLILQLVVIGVGLLVVFHPDRLVDQIDLFSSPTFTDAIYATVLATLAYAGIEAVSNLAPDLNLNPKDFGRVVVRSAWMVPLLYAGMAVVALMAVPVVSGPAGPETALGGEFIEAPVLGVVSAYDPHWVSEGMRWLVALVAAPLLIFAANTAMLGVSRHTYTLAVNRQIPSWIGQLGRRYEVPYKAILICGLAVFALALVGNVELLAGIYAFGATLAITIAHVSVIKLRRDEPDRVRPYRIPWNFNFRGTSVPAPALLGAILSGLALLSVVLLHDAARWVGLSWLLVGLVGYVIYRKGIEQVSLTKQVTVEAHALTRPKISVGLHNIIVPIFGTNLDDDIVSTAGRLAADEDFETGEEGARLTVLYLIEVPMALDLEGPIDPKLEAEAFRASNRAREVAEEYADVQVGVEIVRTRKIGGGIIDAARRWDADAIVLGAEPPSLIKGGWMLGGTGESRPEEVGPATTYVLKNAPCRVLLTAPPTDAVPE